MERTVIKIERCRVIFVSRWSINCFFPQSSRQRAFSKSESWSSISIDPEEGIARKFPIDHSAVSRLIWRETGGLQRKTHRQKDWTKTSSSWNYYENLNRPPTRSVLQWKGQQRRTTDRWTFALFYAFFIPLSMVIKRCHAYEKEMQPAYVFSPYGNHRRHRYLGILYIVNIQQSNDPVNFHPMYLPCYSLEFKLVRV